MAGEIFSVSTSSLDVVTINNSLTALPSSTIDFSSATYVSGTFQGIGTGLTGLTASSIGTTVTASLSNTASYVAGGSVAGTVSNSTTSLSSSWVSASVFITTAQTASYISSANLPAHTASWAVNSSTSSYITSSNIVGNVASSSYSLTASYALNSNTGTSLETGSTYPITASWSVSASWSPSTGGTTLTTGSTYPITASWATNLSGLITSASYATTSSWSMTANVFAGIVLTGSFTDNTSSREVYIGAGTANLYNNPTGNGGVYTYPLLPVTFSVPTSTSASFIYAATNGITGAYGITTNITDIDGINKVYAFTLYRADEDTHWIQTGTEGLALANRLENRLIDTSRFAWKSGLTLTDTGSTQTPNHYVISAGVVWYGATQVSQNSFDSRLTESVSLPVGYHETHWVYHSASQWIIPTGSSIQIAGQYNNFYYDDGNNLQPLTSGYYCLNYFYRILGDNSVDDDTFIVISQAQYSDVASAENDSVPSNVPTVLSDVGILVGRMIVQSGSTSASKVESAFTTQFGSSGATTRQHNSLIGLQGGGGGEYYHLTQADYIGTGTGTVVRQSAPTITGLKATGSLSGTSSWSNNSVVSSTSLYSSQSNWAVSSSYASSSTSASYLLGNHYGNLFGTALYASSSTFASQSVWSVSSSYASSSTTAGTATNLGLTAYAISVTYASMSNWSVSSSYASSSTTAGTSTTATNLGQTAYNISVTFASQSQWAVSSSYASSSTTAGTATTATNLGQTAYSISVTYASRSFWATSASYASSSTTAGTATTATNLGLTAYNISVTYASQSQWSVSSSYASSSLSSSYALSASWAPGGSNVTSVPSSSYASSSLSSSYALTASYAVSATATIPANLTVTQLTASFGAMIGFVANNPATLHISGSPGINALEVDVSTGNDVFIINSTGTSSISFLKATGSLQGSASYSLSASWAPGGTGVSSGGSYDISASYASSSTYVSVSSSAADFGYAIALVTNSGSGQQILIDGSDLFTFNPATETLGYANLFGTASWSTSSISSSYSSNAASSNIHLIQSTGSNATAYLMYSLNTGSYQTTYVTTSIFVNPSTGTLTSTILSGSSANITRLTASFISASNILVQDPVATGSSAKQQVPSKNYVDNVSSFGLDFYLRSTTSSIVSTYRNALELSTPLSSSSITLAVGALTANQYIVNYISEPLGVNNINQGLINVRYQLYISGNGTSGVCSAHPELFIYSASVEKPLFVSGSPVVYFNVAPGDTNTSFLLTSSYTVNPTDRIVLKLKADDVTGTPDVTVTHDGKTGTGISIPIDASSIVFKLQDTASYATTAATASYISGSKFSRGGTMYNSTGVTSAVNLIVWQAPVACTVTNVAGYQVGGTNATINARKNGTSNHLASSLAVNSANTWTDGGAVQNTSYAIGDKLEIMIVSTTGNPTQVAVQVNFTK